jgi:hypothetical protein
MKEFENTCQELGLPLYVLPPKRPDYNGGIERGNGVFRTEFYARQDLLVNNNLLQNALQCRRNQRVKMAFEESLMLSQKV